MGVVCASLGGLLRCEPSANLMLQMSPRRSFVEPSAHASRREARCVVPLALRLLLGLDFAAGRRGVRCSHTISVFCWAQLHGRDIHQLISHSSVHIYVVYPSGRPDSSSTCPSHIQGIRDCTGRAEGHVPSGTIGGDGTVTSGSSDWTPKTVVVWSCCAASASDTAHAASSTDIAVT